MRIAAGSRYANACWLSAAPGCCDCTEAVHEMPHVWWRTALLYAGSTAQQLAPLLHYLRGPGHKTLLLPPPVLGAGRGCCRRHLLLLLLPPLLLLLLTSAGRLSCRTA